MCLPDFIEFRQVPEDAPLIGYRHWRCSIKGPVSLMSEYQNYTWYKIEGSILVKKKDSGIYAYNNYNNYYYNNYYNYNNNYNYYYNNNYNYYYYSGIILQWGNIAIHEAGQRSEFAKVKTLFTIRESDAGGIQEFLDWIPKFNSRVELVAKIYNANTIHWQDFIESNKANT